MGSAESAETFSRIRCHTSLELLPQGLVVDVTANQHQLVLAITGPVGVVDGKPFACQMEHMASFAFVEPEDSLGSEHLLGHLVVEEVLELAQGERSITLEGHGGESLDCLMIRVITMAVVMVMAVVVVMIVPVIVPMVVVMAVAMAVIVVAVIQARIVGGGTHLVGFEQADTEQQGQGDIPFHRSQDAGIVLDVSEFLLNDLKPLFGDEITLVQQQDVAINHLGSANFRLEHDFIEVLCIDQRDDRIKAGLIPQFTAEKSHRNRQGIGQTGGFDDDVVERFRALHDPFHGLHQFVVDRAADATIA